MDHKRELVSIVLPVYNGARFLRQSIDSCLNQTYQNIELIVVDDGSKDDSRDVVRSYEDPRIKLICHEINKKLPAALNTGFRYTTGVYLTWTSHDNYYAPTAVAEMVQFLRDNPHIHLVFANMYAVDESGKIIGELKPGPFETLNEANGDRAVFLYTRTVYEKVGNYNERAFLVEDYEYWLRASTSFTFGHLDRPLYNYRCHPDSLSGRFDGGAIIEAELAMKRKILGRSLWRNRLLLHRAHLDASFRLLYGKNNRSAARRAALWAIAFDPKCLTEYYNLVNLAEICLGRNGFRLLQRAKHAIQNISAAVR